MPNHIHIDRRVLYSFLIGMVVINAAVLLVSWGVIMAGKNDFPPFYASAQMVREGQASRLYDFETVGNPFDALQQCPLVHPRGWPDGESEDDLRLYSWLSKLLE